MAKNNLYALQKIQEVLEEIGLNKKEATLSLALLRIGKGRVRDIAKETKLNRTTIYGILKNLQERGLVFSTTKRNVLEFQAIAPASLIQYLDRLRHNLGERKKEIEEVLPQLNHLKKSPFPRISFFEGVEGVKQAYEDTLLNNKGKELLDLTGTEDLEKTMGSRWADYYIKKRAGLGIRASVIAPDNEWSRRYKNEGEKVMREMNIIPSKYNFGIEVDIYDDKVGFFSYSEKEPVAIIIEDGTISQAMRTIFNYIKDTATENHDPTPNI